MTYKKILLVVCCATFALSCKKNTGTPGVKTNHEYLNQKVDRSGPEYTSRYICPMHCEGSGSDSAGICPVCKMDYVENKHFGKE